MGIHCSVNGAWWEHHASVNVAWSGQGRDNLDTTLGQGRDNPFVFLVMSRPKIATQVN